MSENDELALEKEADEVTYCQNTQNAGMSRRDPHWSQAHFGNIQAETLQIKLLS